MAHRNNDSKMDDVMELLIENGFEGFADVLRILLNEAMKIERDQALGAQLYERTQGVLSTSKYQLCIQQMYMNP